MANGSTSPTYEKTLGPDGSDVAAGSGFAISLGPFASLGARTSDKLSPSAPSAKESRYGISRAPPNFEMR